MANDANSFQADAAAGAFRPPLRWASRRTNDALRALSARIRAEAEDGPDLEGPGPAGPWAEAEHGLATVRHLTEEDVRAEDPPGFRGTLYEPQRTLLAAMVALEAAPRLALRPAEAGCPAEWAPLVQTRVARVSATFSFGKTVLSLALVCARRGRAPAGGGAEMAPLPSIPGGPAQNCAVVMTRGGSSSHRFNPGGVGFLPEVAVRYGRVLPLTVVVAASSVISQWDDNTRRFTDLSSFTVENVHSLREFEQRFRAGALDGLDLLFLKAGRVTTSFVVDGEAPCPPTDRARSTRNRPLLAAIGAILEGVLVTRLIVDDFDTIKLGGDDHYLPALFTWLISATRRVSAAVGAVRGGHGSVEEFFRANVGGFPVLGGTLDDVVNHTFNLGCAPEYVAAHINSTAIGFRSIFIPGGHAARILHDLGVAEEVVEMAHAGAAGTASQALGISAASIGDVVRRVLSDRLDGLRRATRALARAARARAELRFDAAAPPAAAAAAKDFRAKLKHGDDAAAAAAIAGCGGVLCGPRSAALASLEGWAARTRDEKGNVLLRMRDNVREGECLCCKVPFERGEDAAYVLSGCCQLVVCEPCILRPSGKASSAGRHFIQRCPNCARDIPADRLGEWLVRIGPELDIETSLGNLDLEAAAAAADGAGEPPAPPAPPAAPAAPAALAAPAIPAAAPDAPAGLDVRLRALVQCIRGVAVDCLSDVSGAAPFIGGLLAGRRNMPWPDDRPKKWLVYSSHSESTRSISEALDGCGISHCVFRGARAEKDAAVRLFREAVSVMLVSSARDSSGLDLPWISHVVFYHLVADKQVAAQVAARGQRLGRQHNYEVIRILDEVEANKVRGAPALVPARR